MYRMITMALLLLAALAGCSQEGDQKTGAAASTPAKPSTSTETGEVRRAG